MSTCISVCICLTVFALYYVYMHIPVCVHMILIGFCNDLQGEAGQPGIPGESVRIIIQIPVTSPGPDISP